MKSEQNNKILVEIDFSQLVNAVTSAVKSELGRKEEIFYNLQEAMNYLGVRSSTTFHKRRIEAEVPRAPHKGKYSQDQLNKILNARPC